MAVVRRLLALTAIALLATPALAAPAKSTPAGKASVAVQARWPAAPGDMNLGNPNAPVHVVEYLSLTCPHCAHFNAETYPAFKAKYVDTGRVYYTIRELLTAPANVAAAGFLMARCGDGSHYFQVVDQVFKSQSRWQEGSIKPIFVEIAKANGLTEDQFNACLTDDKAQAALEARINYAVNTDHVQGTPTFFINGAALPNTEVPDLAALDAAIAKALKAPPPKGGR
jgi:protein-disulfide isomerase